MACALAFGAVDVGGMHAGEVLQLQPADVAMQDDETLLRERSGSASLNATGRQVFQRCGHGEEGARCLFRHAAA